MRVVLSTFARSGIEAFSGCDIAAGVRAALRHYTQGEGPSARRASDIPRFLLAPSEDRSGADFELAVDPEIQAVLEREARESDGISVEQIANQAVLLYLADRDRASGPREARERQLIWV
jgi:hypothetical protein